LTFTEASSLHFSEILVSCYKTAWPHNSEHSYKNCPIILRTNHSSCWSHTSVKIKYIDEGLCNVQKAYINPDSKVTQAFAVLVCVGLKHDGKV